MPIPPARLIASIPSACTLGEGPVWDDRHQCLWFTDIQAAQLLRWDHAGGRLDRLALPERLGSLALTSDPDVLLLALASGFALFTPASGALHWLHRLETADRGLRLNDGRVDRQGRFWAGTMVEDDTRAPPERASLWRLDPPGTAAPVALRDGIGISNSIAFSPDGAQLYFADSPTRRIMRHPCPPGGAPLGPGAMFAELPNGHFPDGSDVDARGWLWNAEWGGRRVTAHAPDGKVMGHVPVPVSQPSCIAFGGPALDLMFVTTAREGLDAATLANEPDAGNLLVFSGPFQGLPANRFPLF